MKKLVVLLSCLAVITTQAAVQPVHPGENLWKVVARIGETVDNISVACGAECAATPLSGPGPITISEPGVYCLTEDISGASDAITITASHVVLDLNGKKVSGGNPNNINVTGQSAVLIKNGFVESGFTNGILVDGCSKIALADIYFIGNATGASIIDSTSVRVEHCNFVGQTASGTGAGALVIDSSNNVLVRDNAISNNAGNGILMRNNAIKNRIEGNVCNQNQTGIYLNDGCVKNELIGNTCNENSVENIDRSGSGIYLGTSCSENVLSGNTCTGNSAEASGDLGSASNGGSGIYLYSVSNNNVLSGNTCTGNSAEASGGDALNGGSGIYLGSCSENVIQNNTCSGNAASGGFALDGGSGIFLFAACNNNVLSGNTCNDQVAGPTDTGFGIIVQAINCENNVIQANRCLRNTKGIEDRGAGTVSFDNASVDIGATAIVIS